MTGVRVRRWARTQLRRADDGFFALELALFAPLIVVMLLTVVALGDVEQGRLQVDQAASAGARAASLAYTPGQADTAGRAAVSSTLAQAGLSCAHLSVEVEVDDFRPGGQVTVRVGCDADLSRLALTGVPGSLTVRASSTAAIEVYRDIGAGNR